MRATAAAGGVVANYAEVVALRHVAGRVGGAELRDRASGETLSVEARAVVNATGPWIDRVRALEDPGAPPLARLSKGVHLLLDLDRSWSAALTIPHDSVRVTFAYPWQGMLLLGTTDTLYEGDPSEAGVEPRTWRASSTRRLSPSSARCSIRVASGRASSGCASSPA